MAIKPFFRHSYQMKYSATLQVYLEESDDKKPFFRHSYWNISIVVPLCRYKNLLYLSLQNDKCAFSKREKNCNDMNANMCFFYTCLTLLQKFPKQYLIERVNPQKYKFPFMSSKASPILVTILNPVSMMMLSHFKATMLLIHLRLSCFETHHNCKCPHVDKWETTKIHHIIRIWAFHGMIPTFISAYSRSFAVATFSKLSKTPTIINPIFIHTVNIQRCLHLVAYEWHLVITGWTIEATNKSLLH